MPEGQTRWVPTLVGGAVPSRLLRRKVVDMQGGSSRREAGGRVSGFARVPDRDHTTLVDPEADPERLATMSARAESGLHGVAPRSSSATQMQ
jgi:hypothetical protein